VHIDLKQGLAFRFDIYLKLAHGANDCPLPLDVNREVEAEGHEFISVESDDDVIGIRGLPLAEDLAG
jgi:hypothetical protein